MSDAVNREHEGVPTTLHAVVISFAGAERFLILDLFVVCAQLGAFVATAGKRPIWSFKFFFFSLFRSRKFLPLLFKYNEEEMGQEATT